MAGTLSPGLAGAGRWLRKEFVAILPVFVFFLVGFLLLITLIKLALAQFSVEMTVVSRAVIGALLAAKAALVLDAPLTGSLAHYRRIIAVAVKSQSEVPIAAKRAAAVFFRMGASGDNRKSITHQFFRKQL
jgi:hypothetical protein